MVVGVIEVSGCHDGSMRWAMWVGKWGLHLARVGVEMRMVGWAGLGDENG